jgi:hypothetical protein
VGDEALELRDALLAVHEVAREAAANVLPEQGRARLKAHEDENAAKHPVRSGAGSVRKVPL